MKLEIHHLAPYLPYSLKVIMEGKKTNVAWMSTKNISVIIPDGIGEYKKIHLPYSVFKNLFEWHFDVFGLIEQGLAIDINTLK
jgi:hypothetical protein